MLLLLLLLPPQAFIYGLFAVLIIIATEIVALSIINIYCELHSLWPHNKLPHYSRYYWTEYWIFVGWLEKSTNQMICVLRVLSYVSVAHSIWGHLCMCGSVFCALSRAAHTHKHTASTWIRFLFHLTFLSHVHNRLISNWQFIARLSLNWHAFTPNAISHTGEVSNCWIYLQRTIKLKINQLIDSIHFINTFSNVAKQ